MSSIVNVQIIPKKALPLPAVYAALGMAVSYYAYPLLVSIGLFPLLGLLILSVIAVCFLRVLRYSQGIDLLTVQKAGILITAAAVGISLGIASRRSVGSSALGLPAESITAVSGILLEDPRTLQGGSGLGVMELKYCTARGGLRASAQGTITVFFPSESIPRLKEFGRGCEIYTDGIYTSGPGAAGDRGPLFRASSVHIVTPAPAMEQFRTGLRITLIDKFQGRTPNIWGSLASALLLGVRDDLDIELSNGFRNAGCSHILALSGMHLAILSGVLAFLLRRPLGLKWASLIGAVFIVFYVFVAGSQPSLVRAAIMYLIGTFCLWGFLKRNPLSLLGIAFIIQLVFQSEMGLSYSFILSYLALAGILTLGVIFHSLSRGRLPEILSAGLSASIGAFIVTAPVVILFFGTLRPIGVLVGLILAPLSSLFMVLALAALGVSFLPFPLWNVFDFLLFWLYRLLEFLVTLAGRFPGISISKPVPVLISSILFWLLILFIQKRDEAYRNSIASFN